MSMVVKARIYYAIAIVERWHYIIVHIAIAIIPREIWIHHPAHNYIWGRGQSFVFLGFRPKLWMGVGQDPKLVSENTMQCYMAYFTILSIFFSM